MNQELAGLHWSVSAVERPFDVGSFEGRDDRASEWMAMIDEVLSPCGSFDSLKRDA